MSIPDITIPTQHCPHCGQEKPVGAFYWRNQQKGIRHVTCKQCLADKRRSKGKRAPVKSLKKASARKPKQLALMWEMVCYVCHEMKPIGEFGWSNKAQGKRQGACKKCSSMMTTKWRNANLETVREKDRARAAKNKKQKCETTRRWNLSNPDRKRVNNLNRIALQKNAPGTFTIEDVEMMKAAQTFDGELLCMYCGEPMTNPQVDHMVPLTRGGSNWPGNLCLACGPCNSSKKTKTLVEWTGRY